MLFKNSALKDADELNLVSSRDEKWEESVEDHHLPARGHEVFVDPELSV